MKVLLAPHGTRGDVQPTLALGIALRRRGHEVEVATPHDFAPWIESFGFTAHPISFNVSRTLRNSGDDSQKLGWQFRHLVEDLIPAQFESLPAICPDADIIVGAGLQFAGPSVAESRGVPYIAALYCPVAIPSRHHAPPTMKWQRAPAPVNSLVWWVGRHLTDAVLRRPVNLGRRSLGLPPLTRPIDHLFSRAAILAADPSLAPAPPDNTGVATTGAWILEPAGLLDADVEVFLQGGEPPVYVGFGSMVTGDPDHLTRQVVEAVERAGCRLLLGSGWTGLGSRDEGLPSWCKVIHSAPHHLLFPRVAAVAHHGGAGTTTTAARAGVPQIIVPHLLDQFYWAHRVHALGLGPKPLPIRRLNPERFAARLKTVLREPAYLDRAAKLGTEIRARDGCEAGAGIVEATAARFRKLSRGGQPFKQEDDEC